MLKEKLLSTLVVLSALSAFGGVAQAASGVCRTVIITPYPNLNYVQYYWTWNGKTWVCPG